MRPKNLEKGGKGFSSKEENQHQESSFRAKDSGGKPQSCVVGKKKRPSHLGNRRLLTKKR